MLQVFHGREARGGRDPSTHAARRRRSICRSHSFRWFQLAKMRLTIHHKAVRLFTCVGRSRLWLRLGCGLLRSNVVEAIDRGAIRTRNQMPVRVDRDGDRRVAQVLLHVYDRFALLQQQGRARMPQIMQPDVAQRRRLKQPSKHVPHVPLFERRALEGREDPRRHRLPLLEPARLLPTLPVQEDRGELRRQIDAVPFMRFWRRQHATDDVPLHEEEPPVPVQIAVLERQELAEPSPVRSAHRTNGAQRGKCCSAVATRCAASSRVSGCIRSSVRRRGAGTGLAAMPGSPAASRPRRPATASC